MIIQPATAELFVSSHVRELWPMTKLT